MTALYVLKTLVTISDIFFLAVLAFFMRPLQWSNSKDRPTIVGFAWMISVLAVNVGLLWVNG